METGHNTANFPLDRHPNWTAWVNPGGKSVQGFSGFYPAKSTGPVPISELRRIPALPRCPFFDISRCLLPAPDIAGCVCWADKTVRFCAPLALECISPSLECGRLPGNCPRKGCVNLGGSWCFLDSSAVKISITFQGGVRFAVAAIIVCTFGVPNVPYYVENGGDLNFTGLQVRKLGTYRGTRRYLQELQVESPQPVLSTPG